VRARGFTLVEVMVALAIVAITLPALLMALYQQVDHAAYLRDKTLAEMVAVNKLSEMRLVVASTRTLSAGKDSGVTPFVDREWHWWLETINTEVNNFFRVEIRVALSEERREQPLYMLSAFMFGDLQIDPEGLQGGSDDGGSGQEDGSQSGDDGGVGTGENTQNPGDSGFSPDLGAGITPDGQ
jgi:general secretion pathway protein I